MVRGINIFFAIVLVAFCSSCSDKTFNAFQVPAIQEQKGVDDNSNLDQFVDEVKRYPDDNTDAQKDAFYNDNSTSN